MNSAAPAPTCAELVDIPKLQALMESFSRVIGIANAVIDLEGTVLTSSGWQDSVLMDIQMPVMDGIEATRNIREDDGKNGTHTNIIALTAHALVEQRNHLLASGFDGYVAKPLDLAVLNAEMRRVLHAEGAGESHG